MDPAAEMPNEVDEPTLRVITRESSLWADEQAASSDLEAISTVRYVKTQEATPQESGINDDTIYDLKGWRGVVQHFTIS
jgi:hypothetical protein